MPDPNVGGIPVPMSLDLAIIEALLKAGFGFCHDRWGPNIVCFVTSFATTAKDVDHLLSQVRREVDTLHA